jgi:hypothetical protein
MDEDYGDGGFGDEDFGDVDAAMDAEGEVRLPPRGTFLVIMLATTISHVFKRLY